MIQSPTYRATTQLIIQRSDSLGSGPQNAEDAARNVDTETAVLRSKLVQDAAEKALGHKPSIAISSSETSDVVSLSASSGEAAARAADANAYASAYVNLRRTQNIDDLQQAVQQVNLKIAAIKTSLAQLPARSPDFGDRAGAGDIASGATQSAPGGSQPRLPSPARGSRGGRRSHVAGVAKAETQRGDRARARALDCASVSRSS